MPYLLLLLALWSAAIVADETAAIEPPAPMLEMVGPREPTTIDRLSGLRSEIHALRRELEDARKELAREKNEERIAHLTRRIAELPRTIDNLNSTFDRIALGGLDKSVFSDKPPEKFNWQDELLQITRPLFSSLKELTEKPRMIEHLRSEIVRLEHHQQIIQRALTTINTLVEEGPTKDVQTRLYTLREEWQQREIDNRHALELAIYQISTLQGEVASSWDAFLDTLKDFLTGRGLTLSIAAIAILLVWLTSRSLLRLAQRVKPTSGVLQTRRQRTRQRAIAYIYRIGTVITMIVVLISVFYARSDLLLLALTIIAVVMMVLALRQTLPKYIKEIRLLLDFGTVRENERIIYNGVPFEVKSINAFAILVNPELEGFIRLPLDAIVDQVSRPAEEEPWFPCSVGDYLMLDDGRMAEVLRLTVEQSELRIARSLWRLPIADLYTLQFRNLSRVGFGLPITFGVDYRHQAICLDEIPQKMRTAVDQAMRASEWARHYSDLLVEFKEAGANSLDYIIYLSMHGGAAGSYFSLGRLVQRTLVELCNREGWVIPFAQLTLHQGEGFAALNR
jgi:small-conductance mechanosensitive channel